MKVQHLLTVLFSLALIMFVFSCGSTEEGNAGGENEFDTHGQAGVVDDVSKKNILQIAISSPDHTTLVAGVQAAELENVLVNPGPLTVFAPNNAAFDKLPEGTLDELLKPENKIKLGKIITGHIVHPLFP